MRPSVVLSSLTLSLCLLSGCQSAPGQAPCSDFDCSGHGTCVVTELGGEPLPTCLCDSGYAPTPSGWLCLPMTDSSLCAGILCSGHGTCVSSQGLPACVCDSGYTVSSDGTKCDDPCAGVSCSSHGTCQRTAAGAQCSCDTGYAPSVDGKQCEALSTASYLMYSLTYTKYPGYSLGYSTLKIDSSSGDMEEGVVFGLGFDWGGGGGVARKTRLKLIVDAKGQDVTALDYDDQYRQGTVTRLRRGKATLNAAGITAEIQRLDRSATMTVAFNGPDLPLPMLGGHEYPGWDFGSFSPAFYRLALQRYDETKADPQYLEVLWPTSATVGQVRVEADAASTTSKPVLRFPDYQIKVIYDDKGDPESIVLEGNDMAWSRYQGAPADLNLAEAPAATPFSAKALPTDGQSSTVAIGSKDGTTLAGTLVVPGSGSGPYPAVLLVSDPRARDRDAPMYVLPQPLYQHLAAHLAHAGYASLRYDPRGRGKSQGSLDQVTLAQLTNDAEAAFDQLAQSSEVDSSHVFVLSHGSNGPVALGLLDAQRKGGAIAGYIALAPLLKQLDQAALYRATAQLEASGFSTKFIKDQQKYYTDTFAEIVAGTYSESSYDDLATSLWKDLLAFDGTSLLTGFNGPVLALRGDQDLDYPPEQLQAIQDAATQAAKTDVTSTTLAGLTTMLVPDDKTKLLELAPMPLELSQSALDAIINWLDANK